MFGSKAIIQSKGANASGSANARYQPPMEAIPSYRPSTTVYVQDDGPRSGAERNNPLGRHTIHDRGMDLDARGRPEQPLASSCGESQGLDGKVTPECGFSKPQ
jgi:hypothetical protein